MVWEAKEGTSYFFRVQITQLLRHMHFQMVSALNSRHVFFAYSARY